MFKFSDKVTEVSTARKGFVTAVEQNIVYVIFDCISDDWKKFAKGAAEQCFPSDLIEGWAGEMEFPSAQKILDDLSKMDENGREYESFMELARFDESQAYKIAIAAMKEYAQSVIKYGVMHEHEGLEMLNIILI